MYEFKLAPAYCLFNGVAIQEQKDCYIRFLIEKPEDEILKERLKRSFEGYLENLRNLRKTDFYFSGQSDIQFEKGTRNQIRKFVSELYATEKSEDKSDDTKNEHIEDAAAVILLDRILTEGKQKNATDIHIENKKIRFRINGALENYMNISGKRYEELIRRIKLLAGMNILEKKKTQDGHFVYGNRNPLFIRASSVSVIDDEYGCDESIVLRLLDTSRIPLSIDYLGFNENQIERINKLQEEKNGLILVCGPTGSGKSTTVASILVEIEKKYNGRLKIISLEDPPEYYIPCVSQIKIDNNSNNYKTALNHIFRLDPDVIMIGEIRDESSAAAAIKASLTGHLVFATLHTGSVAESILRMENLGIDRKIMSSVLRGVICQELNYIGSEIKLYCDIGIPVKKFASRITDETNEEELEKLFIHETNYSEIFTKTLELLSGKEEECIRQEGKSKKMWKGRKKHGEVYKRIV